MKAIKELTVKRLRHLGPETLPGPWVVRETDDGFDVRCGELVLHTINSRRPRIFKNLDTAFRSLRDELGVEEFKVETRKARM